MNVNIAMIIGRLGQDPKLYSFKNGSILVTLSVATTERWTDKRTNEKREQTEWHKIHVHGWLAKKAFQNLKKGNLTYIEGSVKSRSYTNQDNVVMYETYIDASIIYDL